MGLLNGVDVDQGEQAYQITVGQGISQVDLSNLKNDDATFSVSTNNGTIVNPTVTADGVLQIDALAAGRASIRIEDTIAGEVRYLGIRVLTDDNSIPAAPDYLAIGSVSEDSQADLDFWRDFDGNGTNKRIDSRYIYLNGGPETGWRTWTTEDGFRLTSYLRESLKLGMTPSFVWYNIPDGGESYWTNKQHLESVDYMQGYFNDLKFALDKITAEAGDEPVNFILEPDFLGYLMQIGRVPADQVTAMTQAAYRFRSAKRGRGSAIRRQRARLGASDQLYDL